MMHVFSACLYRSIWGEHGESIQPDHSMDKEYDPFCHRCQGLPKKVVFMW